MPSSRSLAASHALGAVLAAGLSVPCEAEPAKALAPIPAATLALMASKDTTADAPLVLRSYKKEAEIEVWKKNRSGRFVYIKSFPICRWSGQLGPKHYSGDRQTPEGFYAIGPHQMNPNSHYYLSFDTGFPNAYDKAHGASGSAVMIHGTCSSMGCFAMTDKQVGELYAIARDALKGGQSAFQLQAYPFHMSAKNMALYRDDPNIGFWRQLEEGTKFRFAEQLRMTQPQHHRKIRHQQSAKNGGNIAEKLERSVNFDLLAANLLTAPERHPALRGTAGAQLTGPTAGARGAAG